MEVSKKDILLGLIRDQQPITGRQQLQLSWLLALPAILAQISSVLMQYIDAAMVGHLGANPSASIGLVSTSTWIFNGFFMAVMSGFSVQVAHRFGAKDFRNARSVARQGLLSVLLFSCALAAVAVAISGPLPHWLGGGEEIHADASAYFRIYSLFLPIGAVGYTANTMLQASGNMKVPSILYVGMGVLDVIFNYLFIYRLDMGVAGAALGTGVAETVTTLVSLWYMAFRSGELEIGREKGS
ncbi:MAG: polysaccharide biosynthesis C-terminal domain-containing protein, partial [Bacteroidales bacterium]|nr:polysaccharide biosynthesis C-terminal domain-containing protein [Bacteroidales bacterium]